jgi:hypothetical protein
MPGRERRPVTVLIGLTSSNSQRCTVSISYHTMPTTRLDTADAVELTELLQGVKEWLTADNEAKASFARFVGSPGYDAADLCTDIERFSFMLGRNDGEHLLE